MTQQADTPLAPAEAARHLDAAAADIDRWTMAQRTLFLQGLRQAAAPLGAGDRWGALEGVMEYFGSRGLGAPGTWISWVCAGLLVSVQDGIAFCLDLHDSAQETPGSRVWADYLYQLQAGDLALAGLHAEMWAKATQAGIDSGLDLARGRGLKPTAVERGFLKIARACNWGLGHRPVVDLMMSAAAMFDDRLRLPTEAVDWCMDNAEAARIGAELAWSLAQRMDQPDATGPLGPLILLRTHLPRLAQAYATAQHRAE